MSAAARQAHQLSALRFKLWKFVTSALRWLCTAWLGLVVAQTNARHRCSQGFEMWWLAYFEGFSACLFAGSRKGPNSTTGVLITSFIMGRMSTDLGSKLHACEACRLKGCFPVFCQEHCAHSTLVAAYKAHHPQGDLEAISLVELGGALTKYVWLATKQMQV